MVYGFVAQKKKCWTRILQDIACLYNLFDKSNSAPGRLKNLRGHSILLIKISQSHSLNHLQHVIVDGGKIRFHGEKKGFPK